ncbi:hypothetical protein CAPTEDRAFT_106247 [Capitella teleta]|uniref:Anaphase-promoting complex subunit 13 n=1 Tax=Capitella teleta TaxID=283909 RepID=R7U1A2_CAPTE|nr:hypothetical protein CAPTEDRAFT_106247 [Capitella teleta]|eukprot:ELT97421.1 hypothetical protein CAPTEDRAFT_106247 [Capitella teleta]
MDSEVLRDGRLLMLRDRDWQKDQLPDEDIPVPQMELPEPEPDNGNSSETLREQDQKWTELALTSLQEQAASATGNPP